jgi:hypothetical protein
MDGMVSMAQTSPTSIHTCYFENDPYRIGCPTLEHLLPRQEQQFVNPSGYIGIPQRISELDDMPVVALPVSRFWSLPLDEEKTTVRQLEDLRKALQEKITMQSEPSASCTSPMKWLSSSQSEATTNIVLPGDALPDTTPQIVATESVATTSAFDSSDDGMEAAIEDRSTSASLSGSSEVLDWPYADAYEGMMLSEYDSGESGWRQEPPKRPQAARQRSQQSKPQNYRHAGVPKNVNLVEQYELSKNDNPTTIMIRSIPNRYNQQDLLEDLQNVGLSGTFDFLYLPIDRGTMSNVGYAFVNFIDNASALQCVSIFQNRRFQNHSKLATVSFAHIQGLDANLAHYEKRMVNMDKHKRHRPMVFPRFSSLLSD